MAEPRSIAMHVKDLWGLEHLCRLARETGAPDSGALTFSACREHEGTVTVRWEEGDFG